MSKPVPLEAEHCYHIYNRGNNGENLFREERNYRHFLALYAKHVLPVVDTFAYCLLKNHFHLLVRIKSEAEQERWFCETNRLPHLPDGWRPKQPAQQFSHCFNAYTKAINNAYGRTGSLFENPFKRIKVDSDAHFVRLIPYIHQNPQRHGLVGDFRAWPWSSYHALRSPAPTRLAREATLLWFGDVEQFEAAHQPDLPYRKVAIVAPDDFD